MDAVLKARNQIADILTMKCPWCSAAWLDLCGCSHVTCSQCQRYFRACCLATEGHAPGCLVFKAKGDCSQMQAAHAELRKRRLRSYLRTLPRAVRTQAVHASAKDLRDLGLSACDFY